MSDPHVLETERRFGGGGLRTEFAKDSVMVGAEGGKVGDSGRPRGREEDPVESLPDGVPEPSERGSRKSAMCEVAVKKKSILKIFHIGGDGRRTSFLLVGVEDNVEITSNNPGNTGVFAVDNRKKNRSGGEGSKRSEHEAADGRNGEFGFGYCGRKKAKCDCWCYEQPETN